MGKALSGELSCMETRVVLFFYAGKESQTSCSVHEHCSSMNKDKSIGCTALDQTT